MIASSHRAHRIAGIAGAMLLALLLMSSSLVWAEVSWQELETDHFTIIYPEKEAAGARVFAKSAERIRLHVVQELGLDFKVKISVYLAPDRKTFNALQPRGHVAEWAVGTAITSQNKIVMFSPKGSLKESVRAETAQIFAHELAHVTLHILARGRKQPHWLQEGVAQLVAREWELRDSFTLTMGLMLNRLIPLTELDKSWPKGGSRARLAYAEALSFVTFLQQNLDLKPLLTEIRAGTPTYAALYNVTGYMLYDLEEQWHNSLHTRHSWIFLLDSGFLWFIMALLLVLGYVLTKLRRRKQYERLDDDHPRRFRRKRRDAEADLEDLLDEDRHYWH